MLGLKLGIDRFDMDFVGIAEDTHLVLSLELAHQIEAVGRNGAQ